MLSDSKGYPRQHRRAARFVDGLDLQGFLRDRRPFSKGPSLRAKRSNPEQAKASALGQASKSPLRPPSLACFALLAMTSFGASES